MANYYYIRPTADESLKHSCNTGSTGYNLMAEEVCDNDATYVSQELSGTEKSASATSTFTLSCTKPNIPGSTVTHAILHVFVANKVSTSGTTTNVKFTGTVSAGSGSVSIEQTATSSTSYKEYIFEMSTGGLDLDGQVASKTATLTTNINITNTKSTDASYRISQMYIAVEYNLPWYTVSTSLVMGCGATTSGTETFEHGSTATARVYLESGRAVKRFIANNVDVTSQLITTSEYTYYNIPSISTNYTCTVYTELPFVKQKGSWQEAKAVWVKENGTWEKKRDVHSVFDTSYKYVRKEDFFNFAQYITYDGSAPVLHQNWVNSQFIKITPNTELTVCCAAPSVGNTTAFNFYDSNRSFLDWWGRGSATPEYLGGISYFTRTLTAAQVGDTAFIKVNMHRNIADKTKVWSNGVVVYDGSRYITDRYMLHIGRSLKDESDYIGEGYVTSWFIDVTPGADIIVQATLGSADITNPLLLNAYAQDGTFLDYWGAHSGEIIATVDDKPVYRRTIPGSELTNVYKVRINCYQKAFAQYCKVWSNGVLVFDGQALTHTQSSVWERGKALNIVNLEDQDVSSMVCTHAIPITANAPLIVQGSRSPETMLCVTMDSTCTVVDSWATTAEEPIATVDGVPIFSRTLSADQVGDQTYCRVNIYEPAANQYCKVWSNGTLVFDGSQHPL